MMDQMTVFWTLNWVAKQAQTLSRISLGKASHCQGAVRMNSGSIWWMSNQQNCSKTYTNCVQACFFLCFQDPGIALQGDYTIVVFDRVVQMRWQKKWWMHRDGICFWLLKARCCNDIPWQMPSRSRQDQLPWYPMQYEVGCGWSKDMQKVEQDHFHSTVCIGF